MIDTAHSIRGLPSGLLLPRTGPFLKVSSNGTPPGAVPDLSPSSRPGLCEACASPPRRSLCSNRLLWAQGRGFGSSAWSPRGARAQDTCYSRSHLLWVADAEGKLEQNASKWPETLAQKNWGHTRRRKGLLRGVSSKSGGKQGCLSPAGVAGGRGDRTRRGRRGRAGRVQACCGGRNSAPGPGRGSPTHRGTGAPGFRSPLPPGDFQGSQVTAALPGASPLSGLRLGSTAARPLGLAVWSLPSGVGHLVPTRGQRLPTESPYPGSAP